MNAIPWAVYSMPEVAGCGLTEEQAEAAGHRIESAQLPLTMSGRFLAENGKKGPGSIKVIKDADTDVLLGVHMVGAGVAEMIYGAAVMIEAELRIKDIQEIVFPHPTVGEVMRDVMFSL
jgi:dihydrolipoamide dehydrogenase